MIKDPVLKYTMKLLCWSVCTEVLCFCSQCGSSFGFLLGFNEISHLEHSLLTLWVQHDTVT